MKKVVIFLGLIGCLSLNLFGNCNDSLDKISYSYNIKDLAYLKSGTLDFKSQCKNKLNGKDYLLKYNNLISEINYIESNGWDKLAEFKNHKRRIDLALSRKPVLMCAKIDENFNKDIYLLENEKNYYRKNCVQYITEESLDSQIIN